MQDNPARAGFVIKPTEYYVVSGDVLTAAYKYLLSQRTSASTYLAKMPPTYVNAIEEYMAIYEDLNAVMRALVSSSPLVDVLEKVKRIDTAKRSTKKQDDTQKTDIYEFLKQFNIGGNGKRDEMHPPADTPPTDEVS